MAELNRETTEVRDTNDNVDNTNTTRTVRTADRADGPLVFHKIVWYIAGIIIALLALRVIFLLLAANQGSPFVDLIYGLSGIFAAPFFGIFGYTPAYGQSVLEISSVVAIAIYALIAWGIAKLATLTSNRTDV
jgi:hypothetical protein